MRKDEKKSWKVLKDSILEKFNHQCAVCVKLGIEKEEKKRALHVHHLIPEKIRKYRLDENNLIPLCVVHHKWGAASAHQNPFWFVKFIEINYPTYHQWVLARI